MSIMSSYPKFFCYILGKSKRGTFVKVRPAKKGWKIMTLTCCSVRKQLIENPSSKWRHYEFMRFPLFPRLVKRLASTDMKLLRFLNLGISVHYKTPQFLASFVSRYRHSSHPPTLNLRLLWICSSISNTLMVFPHYHQSSSIEKNFSTSLN